MYKRQGQIAVYDHDVIVIRYAPTYNIFSSLSYGSQVTAGYDAKTGQLLWGPKNQTIPKLCLLYTSDAADDLLCVDLGGRRLIKKKKKHH